MPGVGIEPTRASGHGILSPPPASDRLGNSLICSMFLRVACHRVSPNSTKFHRMRESTVIVPAAGRGGLALVADIKAGLDRGPHTGRWAARLDGRTVGRLDA